MDSLPPIPTPIRQKWREIRIQVMPVFTFLLAVAGLVLMWHSYVLPASVIGQVEVLQASITAKDDGIVAALTVDRYDTVTSNQVVGVLTLASGEPEVLQTALDAQEADYLLKKRQIDVGLTRNVDLYARNQITLMAQEAQMLEAEADLKFRQADFDRNLSLYRDGSNSIVAQQNLEISKRDRDIASHKLENAKKAYARFQQFMQELEKTALVTISTNDPVLDADFKAQREKLLARTKPVELKIPMDGKVSDILKRPGERVVKGDVILTVSQITSDRIVGYVRQPIARHPTTNDTVLVRTRTNQRLAVPGHIIQVGPSLITVDPVLLSPDTRRREVGLPILISLPSGGLQLMPGEFVDITIQYSKKG